ncbi:MAG: DHA1 family multidrug resistance protein-like MFS transporter, partial [Cellvibrionaceae bacterium]
MMWIGANNMSSKLFGRTKPFEPWERTLYIVFIAQIVNVVGFATIFPFLPLYVNSLDSKFGLSTELLSGLVYAVQGLSMMITAPIWGALADRYGRKLMIARATFGGAVTVLLMAYVQTGEGLVMLRLAQGAVTGTVSAANALVAAVVPREKMGYAMGLMQMALWAGVAIGPLIGGIMADAFGYEMAFILTAILLTLAGLLVWWFVEENFVPATSENGNSQPFWENWKEILSTKGVKPAYSMRFLMGVAQMILMPLAPLFVLAMLPADAPINFWTGLIVGVGGAASVLTAVYLGKLGDRIGHRPVLMVSMVAAAAFYFLHVFIIEVWHLLLLQILVGAAMGGIIPSLTALLAAFTKPGEEGSVYG